MKKPLAILCAVALSATCALCGCKSETPPVYNDLTKLEYKIENGFSMKFNDLLIDTGITASRSFLNFDGGKHAVVKESTTSATTYYLYNLSTGERLAAYDSEIVNVSKNLYYAKPDYSIDEPVYTVIDLSTATPTTATYKTLSSIDGSIYTPTDTYFTDVNGKVVKLSNDALAKDFVAHEDISSLMQVGDYYLKSAHASLGSSYRLIAYDKDGYYAKSFDFNTIFSLSENQEVKTVWNMGNVLYVQTSALAPSDSEDYDYLENMSVDFVKHRLDTYSYDLDSGEVKTYELNYLINSASNKISQDYAVLNCRKITDSKELAYNSSIIALDKNCSLLVDFDSLLPGTATVTFDLSRNVYLTNTVGVTDIYSTISGNKLGSKMKGTTVKSTVYYEVEDTLILAKLDGTVLKTIKNPVKFGHTWDFSTFYYVLRDENTNRHFIYFIDTVTHEQVDAIGIPSASYDKDKDWHTPCSYTINSFYYSFTTTSFDTKYTEVHFFDEEGTSFNNLTNFTVWSSPHYGDDETYIIFRTVDNETTMDDYVYDRYFALAITSPQLDF